jgi:hypothetical protein
MALLRDNVWQGFRQNQQAFRKLQSYPFGKMVLKYNPVVVNSGGMIIAKIDVDCQFNSDALVAQAAGVAPPTKAAEDQFIRSLPSRFGSMPREQQEYLRQADVRLESWYSKYIQTIQKRAAMIADIQEKCPLLCGRLARSPAGRERLRSHRQILAQL